MYSDRNRKEPRSYHSAAVAKANGWRPGMRSSETLIWTVGGLETFDCMEPTPLTPTRACTPPPRAVGTSEVGEFLCPDEVGKEESGWDGRRGFKVRIWGPSVCVDRRETVCLAVGMGAAVGEVGKGRW